MDKKCLKCNVEQQGEYCSLCGIKLVRIDTLCPNGGSGESQYDYFNKKSD